MMKLLNAFLIIAFGGVLFYGSQPEFLRKVSDFTALDIAVILFIPFSIITVHFVSRYLRHKRLTSVDILWLSMALITVVVVSSLVFYVKTETGMAIILASYFASLGWIYTNYVNGQIQRKSHTMNVLIQLRNSAEFNKHRAAVLEPVPEICTGR
jgi:hypothetical protein